MIRGIMDWSLRFRLLFVVAAALLLFFGIDRLRHMALDIYPEFGPVVVEVQSEALGLSAHEVAEFVTVPLEADLLSNIPWVDILRSKSVPGLSSIELIFEPGTELLRARQVVQERLSEAIVALPGASKPPQMLQPRSSMTRVMMVGLSSATQSPIEMSVLARWNIRPRLMGVPGVANVSIWGQREQQLQVQVDPAKMQAQRIPLQEVIETTANALWASPLSFVEASVPGTGGFIDTPNQRIGIQHISPITNATQLAQITFPERPGLRLGDVASVVEDHQPLIGDAVLKNGPGLLLVIEKWAESSTLEVTRGIERAFAAMAPGLGGIEIDSTLYRPASYIEDALDSVTWIMIASAILVILVLMVIFFDWRTALLAAVTIPVSLVAAALFVDLIGGSMNLMVLGGLVVALVLMIDDAVIRADILRRRLREGGGAGQPTATTIRQALAEAHRPLAFSALVVLVGLLPLFFMSGVAGAFMPPVAIAYGAAIVAASVVAVTLAPALALVLFPVEPRQSPPSAFARALRKRYENTVARTLSQPLAPIAAAAILVLVGLGLLTQVHQPSLLPAVRESNFLVHLDGPSGASRPEMTRMVRRVAEEIRAVPGVANVGSHVGRAITSDQVVGIDSGEIWVSMATDAEYGSTLAAIQNVVAAYPNVNSSLVTYPERRVKEVLTGSAKDVVVRVYGEQTSPLRTQAEAVQGFLAKTTGLVDIEVEFPAEEPTVEIQVDLAAAQRLGIKPGDVRRAATTLLSGLQVGSLFQQQKVFEVVVWSTPQTRNSVHGIRDLLIDTPDEGFVRLGDVADVRVVPNPAVVKRESVSRYVDVSANVAGRTVASVEAEIREGLKNLAFPIEYHAEVVTDKVGGFRNTQTPVWPFVVAAAAGIFLLLQAAFGSWRFAAVAFFAIPCAMVGGIIAVFLAGGDLSIGSYLGFLALLGISTRNAVALISPYQEIERERGKPFDAGLGVLGAADRVVPVVTAAVACALALLPVLIAGGRPGLEVVQPLAIVVLGGLVTSTLFHLFVLPAVYLRFWSPTLRDADVSVALRDPALGLKG